MKRLLLFTFIVAMAGTVYAQQTSWLGVTVEDGRDQGVSIRSVEADSPASKAGLRQGDLITEFNRTPVLGAVQFTRLVRETPAGRTIDVKISRENQDQTLQVTTAARPGRSSFGSFNVDPQDRKFGQFQGLLRDMPRVEVRTTYARSGMRVDSLTSQLREFFGVQGDQGVLIASVDAGSAAARAGLKAGDVVTQVDSRVVRSPAEFDREMRSGTGRVTLKVVREKREQDIALDRDTSPTRQ